MPITGLQRMVKQYPFSSGLSQKGDVRAENPPALDICKDVEFDQTGGVQTRKPYAAMGLNISTGGFILSSFVRRIFDNNGELLLFTKDRLYSWVPQSSTWSDRGEHPAAVTSEELVFADNGDQEICDRCEINGVGFYAWQEGAASYVAARDSFTKAVIQSPIKFNGDQRPRLLVVTSAAIKRAMLFTVNTSAGGVVSLIVRVLDPSNVAASVLTAATTVVGANVAAYDVTQVIGGTTLVGVASLTTTTSYTAFSLDISATVATSTKARTCDGAICLASAITSNVAQIVRMNGTAIVGDLINSLTLADVRANDALGTDALATVFPQLTACYPTVTATPEVCDVYESSAIFVSKGSISTAGTVTALAMFTNQNKLASRAFTRSSDAKTYVWSVTDPIGAGAGNLQGTYHLLRSDKFWIATSRIGNAQSNFGTSAHLCSVQPTPNQDEYGFCGVFKRQIINQGSISTSGVQPAFTARAPRDIIVTFDSNDARRCARFGSALYVTGGLVLQYDGIGLSEVNFATGPVGTHCTDHGVAGAIPAGKYGYKGTIRAMNAQGEADRSSSYGVQLEIIAASKRTDDNGQNPAFWITRRVPGSITYEWWRTTVNPVSTTPFYLVSSQDPAAVSPNGYVPDNATALYLTAFTDNATDATIAINEQHPETGNVLPSLPPPPCRLIMSTANRLFVSGIAGLPNQVRYSKYRADGRVAAFNDGLSIDVPAVGGAITGLSFLNETLIVFRQTAIYAFAGDGFDDTGGGSNYASGHVITIDVGATTQESIVATDSGLLFQSSKGWHMLSRAFDVQYIGAGVMDYDAETVLSAHLSTTQHQLRIITPNRCIIFDNTVGQWGEWSIADGLHACVWQGQHVYLSSGAGGPKRQRTDFVGVDYGLDVETAWFDLNQLQGEARVWKILILGEYRGPHQMQIRVGRDYEATGGAPTYSTTYYDNVVWPVNATVVGGPEQVRHGPSRQECQSLKVRITAVNVSGNTAVPPDNEALRLTAIALELGVKEGLYQRLTAAQKV